VGVGLFLLIAACTQATEPHPPTVLDGPAGGATPCERAGYRCASGPGACLTGTVSTGGSLGCPGESAVCCQPAKDGGLDGASDGAASDGASAADGGNDMHDAATADAGATDAALD